MNTHEYNISRKPRNDFTDEFEDYKRTWMIHKRGKNNTTKHNTSNVPENT